MAWFVMEEVLWLYREGRKEGRFHGRGEGSQVEAVPSRLWKAELRRGLRDEWDEQ
jgi:hypothetical protein